MLKEITQQAAPMLAAWAALSATSLWALGFQLGESKEKLRLKYEVSGTDHGTGRVTIVLRLADQGRLAPIDGIDLVVPRRKKNQKSGGYVDLSVTLERKAEGDEEVVRVHVLRELAERAELQIRTHHLDGKQQLRTWYYHSIPLAKQLPAPDGERAEKGKEE